MFDINKIEIDWAGKKLTLETGKIARQADASVVATYGGTVVMANVVAAKKAKPDIDFFPVFEGRPQYLSKTYLVLVRLLAKDNAPTRPEELVC